MSSKIETVMSLLSDCDKKDLLEALQKDAESKKEAEIEYPKKLSMPCPICGHVLTVDHTTEVSGRPELKMYWCYGVNDECRCRSGICIGETKVDELKEEEMSDAEKEAWKNTRQNDLEEYYDEEEEDEEEDEVEDDEVEEKVSDLIDNLVGNLDDFTEWMKKYTKH